MLVRVQARQRGKIGRRALQQKQASAVKLQALVKGRQERKEVKALKEEKTNAVVKLQALTKGRNDRKKVQHLKHVKQEQEAQGHAATTLQKVLRGNKERSKVRAIKEEVRGGVGQWAVGTLGIARLLQDCCFRVVSDGLLLLFVSSGLCAQNNAAIKMQSLQRSKMARRKSLKRKEEIMEELHQEAALEAQREHNALVAQEDEDGPSELPSSQEKEAVKEEEEEEEEMDDMDVLMSSAPPGGGDESAPPTEETPAEAGKDQTTTEKVVKEEAGDAGDEMDDMDDMDLLMSSAPPGGGDESAPPTEATPPEEVQKETRAQAPVAEEEPSTIDTDPLESSEDTEELFNNVTEQLVAMQSTTGTTIDVAQMTPGEAETTAAQLLDEMTERFIMGNGEDEDDGFAFEMDPALQGSKEDAMVALQKGLDTLQESL